MRIPYFIAGLFLVALGVIGIVLPVMPTTIFLILAAGAFARSSPRLEAWLVGHPLLGPPIRRWRETGAIAPKAKVMAVGGMALGYGLFLWSSGAGWLLALAVLAVMAGCAGFVITRPDA